MAPLTGSTPATLGPLAQLQNKIDKLIPLDGRKLGGGNGSVDTTIEAVDTMAAGLELARDLGTLQSLENGISGFLSFRVKSCDWGALDMSTVSEFDRPAQGKTADYGYRCKADLYHQSTGRVPSILVHKYSVFFYRSEDGLRMIPVTSEFSHFAKEDKVT